MLETEDFESDMSSEAHMCSEDDMSSDDVSVDVALVQKKPKKEPKKRYKSFRITSADQVVGWWSKTGKEESDTSRDSKQCLMQFTFARMGASSIETQLSLVVGRSIMASGIFKIQENSILYFVDTIISKSNQGQR